MNSQTSIVSVLRIRPFLMLWLAQIFSQIAINLLNFVLILRIFQLTSSNTAVSGLILFINLPMVLFGLIAGSYVDRWNKKSVLVGTNILRCFLMLFLIIAANNLVFLYILVFLISTVTLFFVPAESPMIPRLVPKKKLLTANAIFTISLYSSILIGYILAGPVLKILGLQSTLVLLSIMFFVAFIFVSVLPERIRNNNNDVYGNKLVKNLQKDLQGAFKFFRKSKEVFDSLLLLTFSQAVIATLAVILPGYATGFLAIDMEDTSFIILAPAALGMVLGAVIIGHIGYKFSKSFLINVGTLLSGIIIFMLPFSNRFVSKFFIISLNNILPEAIEIDVLQVVVVLATLLGLANSFITVSANTVLQDRTKSEFLGRVYGAFVSLSALFSIVPAVVVGGLADVIGIQSVLMISGAVIVLFSISRVFIRKYTV